MKNKIAFIIVFVLISILIGGMTATLIIYDYYKTENIFARNIVKVVEIKSSSDNETWGYATGCFIDDDGTILTNKHVVYNESLSQNYTSIKVKLPTETEYRDAQVLKISEEFDLATIKIKFESKDYFEIKDSVQNGETVYTIGNPNGFGLSFTQGVVSSSSRNVIYKEKTINTIQTDFVINEGNSGGPVFNKKGQLIGLISFRLKDKSDNVIQGVAFAIPARNILKFLDK